MPDELPPVPRLSTIHRRLREIFAPGVDYQSYCTREAAAKTVFVMLYAAAVEGTDHWIRPSMVTEMTDRQARATSTERRTAWYRQMLSARKPRPARAWYAANSREQIRDETIRQGLIPVGAVIERPGLPTTSSLPKYALSAKFAALFDEGLVGEALASEITKWQESHLSRAALARVSIQRSGAAGRARAVVVALPSGKSRILAPGPSSQITKAAVEQFARRFLEEPAVLWLSEPASKVSVEDDALARLIGLHIDPAQELPDLILADVGRSSTKALVVFMEVVATDGAITERRKAALLDIAGKGGFEERNLAFVTAFEGRGHPAFRKSIEQLATGTYAWFVNEPDILLIIRGGRPVPLSKLGEL